jgi:hypothetical protein
MNDEALLTQCFVLGVSGFEEYLLGHPDQNE